MNNKGFSVSGLIYPVFIMIVTLIIVITTGFMTNSFSYRKVISEISGDISGDNTRKTLKTEFEKALRYSTNYPEETFTAISGDVFPHIDPAINHTDWTGNFFDNTDDTDIEMGIGIVDNGTYCAYKVFNMTGVEVLRSGECQAKIKQMAGVTDLNCLVPTGAATKNEVKSGVTFWNAATNRMEEGNMGCIVAPTTAVATPTSVLNGVIFWNANTKQEETGTYECALQTGAATAANVKNGVTFWNANTKQEETGTKKGGYRILVIHHFNQWWGMSSTNDIRTMTQDLRTALTNAGVDYTTLTTANFVQLISGTTKVGTVGNWGGRSAGHYVLTDSYNPSTGVLSRTIRHNIYNVANLMTITPVIVVVPN